MNFRLPARFLSSLTVLSGLCALTPASAQHVQVSSVASRPTTSEVWVANRGNDSVSIVDVMTGTTTHEVDVDVWPRSLSFSLDGSTAFVANQRGNVPVTKHAATPFDGTEIRGSISVIDTASKTVTATITTGVGVEPFGLAVAPNGAYFAVTSMRSAKVQLFSTSSPYNLLAELKFDSDLNLIAPGKTVADIDSNFDGIPDLSEPRSFVIRSDSAKIYVAHQTSGYVSVIDVGIGMTGSPTGMSLASKIDMNAYAFHPIYNPVNVQTIEAQGVPRFFDDIALSPDGTSALVPHVLHNVNHDVNFDFTTVFPAFAGDFSNRVYPAISKFDPTTDTFSGQIISHELTASHNPAEHVAYGGQGVTAGGGVLTLGSLDQPVLGTSVTFKVTGSEVGDMHIIGYGPNSASMPTAFGTLLNTLDQIMVLPGSSFTIAVPNDPSIEGQSFFFQAAVIGVGGIKGLTNGVEAFISAEAIPMNDMGYRAGQPSKLLYNAAGDRAVMLNRASEDVHLFEVSGGNLRFLDVYPRRQGFVERASLDAGTPLGDLPMGMALVEDASTSNDDALLYVHNETSRTLSTLRIDWEAGVITQESPQQALLLGADKMTLSERMGQELFEDGSRAQTTGNFNNSCGSCHIEGGADGNIWQRSDGPRTTMPVYGGPLLTGLLLWKGTRINMAETGPMFGGENGGHGLLDDTLQQGLIDYHKIIPVPLNPNRDPVTGGLSVLAEQGRDLFFGTNETGTNPTLRAAGCAVCHPRDFEDPFSGVTSVRGFTADQLNSALAETLDLQTVDPSCFSLQENIVAENIRNINSAVNSDENFDGMIDVDRNNDGFSDIESYIPLNPDTFVIFERDDPNGFLCPDGFGGFKEFERTSALFSIPTKLGVVSTPPYMHDHSIMSLRTLLDPQGQTSDPTYGDPTYPSVGKFINEFHDIRGNDMFVPTSSKVQVTLQTASAGSTVDADIEALLAYISSL